MAKAKKLPSGSWRVQVFDRFEDVRDKDGKPVLDDKGKLKKKRIYNHSQTMILHQKGNGMLSGKLPSGPQAKNLSNERNRKKKR